uniref:Uncharacterized protein n=1 Tax=Spongospora subterranea TaxID=70186 RepID=A0A0H5R3I4_9EUKA|eukprot:CRZ08663.1 hypothetical protein [Spongospora subterranea]
MFSLSSFASLVKVSHFFLLLFVFGLICFTRLQICAPVLSSHAVLTIFVKCLFLALTYRFLNSIAAMFGASFLFVICVLVVLELIAVSNLRLNLFLSLSAAFRCLFQNLHLVTLTYRNVITAQVCVNFEVHNLFCHFPIRQCDI